MQQLKYTGLDVFCHWSVAAQKRLGAMRLLPCMRAVIACRVWCAAVKKKTHSAANTTVSFLFFASLNTYEMRRILDLREEKCQKAISE